MLTEEIHLKAVTTMVFLRVQVMVSKEAEERGDFLKLIWNTNLNCFFNCD